MSKVLEFKGFKIGDKVECVKESGLITRGMKGVITFLTPSGYPPVGVHWRDFTGGNNCHGTCPSKEGYFVQSSDIKKIGSSSLLTVDTEDEYPVLSMEE